MSLSDFLRVVRARIGAPQGVPERTERRRVAVVSLVFACGIVVAAALAAWRVLVPGVLSNADLSWVIALSIVVILTAGVMSVRGRATRSIAHVLYETEHPVARGR